MRKKSLQAFVLAIGLSMTLLVAAQNQLIPTSLAHSGNVLSAWARTTPQIDGYLRPSVLKRVPYPDTPFPHPAYTWIVIPGEWDDAAKVDFTLTYGSPSESHPATLWVKNDYINLYLAVQIKDEEYHSDDLLYLNFDNNHNGVREVGDDQLGIWGGYPWFLDNYWVTSSSSTLDSNGGGTRDGAGFAQHTASTSTWVFEMVHPLNTNDDAHDFSLSIGSTVGINVLYFDHLGSIGSATWPSSNWAQMADVVIVGPSSPPPSSSVDLTITGIEVTQAVQTVDNSLPLVQGKTTAVRVSVNIGPAFPILGKVGATVFLYGVDGSGKSLGALSTSFDAPKFPNRGTIAHTANFILPGSWASVGSLVLKAFVKASATTQSESNYNNNWMAEKTLTFKATTIPTIYLVKINTGTASSPILPSDAMIAQQENYFKTIYPVSDVNFVIRDWTDVGVISPAQGLDYIKWKLTQLGFSLGLVSGGIDQIYGVTSASFGGSSDPLWMGGSGIAAAGGWGSSQEGTMAHEIDHNWGPGTFTGSYPDYPASPGWGRHIGGGGADAGDLDWPYRSEPEPARYQIHEYGFDTLNSWVIASTSSDLMTYLKTPGSARNPTDPMIMHSKWISAYRWQNVFNFLDPPAGAAIGSIQQVGESFMISGWIGQNGTGSLDPIFFIPGEQESPSIPGNYSIVLKDNVETTLLTHWFKPQFINTENQTQDPAYFTILLPYNANTTRVLLKYGATVLDEIDMSAHSPQVTVLSPNGGEIWNATGLQTVSWTASDLDNDTLTYRLYYSPDNGITWTPISPNIKGLSYKVDPSHFKASNQARIALIATDGINIGIDASNFNFSVLNHPPTAEIVCPYETDLWFIGMTIPFRGTGTDPDETLPESAFSWTSDLDGFLGYGRNLPIVLSGGVHYVTLTVTDSEGATATDIIQVTVIPDIFGLIPIPSIPSLFNQTAVGQGYTAKIKVQVNNPGSITRSFNMTASANGVPFQTIPVLDLPGGNSTYLEFLWNTAGKPKGIYNITTMITLPEYEIIQHWNTIQIAIVGDITGTMLRVPDGKVDIKDLATVAKVYGILYPDIKFDPNCDLTGSVIGLPDGKVDIKDLAAVAKNYGKIDP